jgi:ABC-2 type transport system ATP-binding protein
VRGHIPSTELSIQTEGLTKRFGQHAAVDRIDLAVPTGAIFGFLGPNGSGKTTTIRLLLGLASATSGGIRVLGQEMPTHLRSVLPRVGALVEGPAFYPFLSGAANLHRLDTADRNAPSSTRRNRVAHSLHQVGLAHAAGKKVRAYSLGMKQRLGIANALLVPRELLILDEPTNGLDPQGTREVRSLVRSLAAEGTTVFVSSHLLAEVEQICTHAAIMSAGSLVAQGTLEHLRQSGQERVRVLTPDVAAARQVLARLGLVPETAGTGRATGTSAVLRAGGTPRRSDGAGVAPAVVAPIGGVAARSVPPEVIVSDLVSAGVRVRGFAVEGVSLEERFVALTGEGFDVAE